MMKPLVGAILGVMASLLGSLLAGLIAVAPSGSAVAAEINLMSAGAAPAASI